MPLDVAFGMHQGFTGIKGTEGSFSGTFLDHFSVTLELSKLPCHSVRDFDSSIIFSRGKKMTKKKHGSLK